MALRERSRVSSDTHASYATGEEDERKPRSMTRSPPHPSQGPAPAQRTKTRSGTISRPNNRTGHDATTGSGQPSSESTTGGTTTAVRRIDSLASLKQRHPSNDVLQSLADRAKSMPPDSRSSQPVPVHVQRSRSRRTVSSSRKENIPIEMNVRRRPLSNVTNTRGRPHSQNLGTDTIIKSQPLRASNHGGGASAGLRIELNGRPLVNLEETMVGFGEQDDAEAFVYCSLDDFLPPIASTPLDTHSSQAEGTNTSRPFGSLFSSISSRSDVAGLGSVNTTPLREAIAAFSDIFSSGGSKRSPKSDTTPSGSTPTEAPRSPIAQFADSVSRLTTELALSIGTQSDQYDEDAVAHNEMFEWESEMRALEMQCGVCR